MPNHQPIRLQNLIRFPISHVHAEFTKIRSLESSLVGYSRAVTAADDPKLRQIRRAVDGLRDEGHKVLVFSKFTDTVDVVRDFLSLELDNDRVGTYTGKGGELWDSGQRVWRVVEKDAASPLSHERIPGTFWGNSHRGIPNIHPNTITLLRLCGTP